MKKRIEVYDGVIGIREKPGMYVGSTESEDGKMPKALIQLIREILANSTDEAIDGYGTLIEAILDEEKNLFILKDNGRGMPKGLGDDFSEVIDSCTKPHASGKFSDANYKNKGVTGTHGIGLKAVNALSKFFKLKTISKWYDKKGKFKGLEEYEIEFHINDVLNKKIIRRFDINDLEEITSTSYKFGKEIIKTGTEVHFIPDDGFVNSNEDRKVFSDSKIKIDELKDLFKTSAYLTPSVTLKLNDEMWHYENGLRDFVNNQIEELSVIEGSDIDFDSDIDILGKSFNVSGSLTFTNEITEKIVSFANGVKTIHGGTHLKGFLSGITKAINEYLKDKKLTKDASVLKNGVSANHITQGLYVAFHTKIPGSILLFEGQTKETLGTKDAKTATEEVIYREMIKWLYDNPKVSAKIIENILESKKYADLEEKNKKASKKVKDTKSKTLGISAKFQNCSSKKASEKEIFLVEGDSASNIGRNAKFQAVLPLKGKILNTYGTHLSSALANEEISTIASVLGAGIGKAFEVDKVKFHKVIIATDADADGFHIRTLLITLFQKLFPGLIEKGHVYVTIPPLYVATAIKKGKVEKLFFYSESEKNKSKVDLSKYSLQRFKGLGEMNPSEVKEFLVAPESRKIKKLVIEDVASANKALKITMGNDVALRKAWIDSLEMDIY